MIAIDELQACAKRQEIIMNSSDDPAERFVAMNIMSNLMNMLQQFNGIIKSPDFKTMVTEFEKEENKDKP